MADEPGISIRMIREYDIEKDRHPVHHFFVPEAAAELAMADERDVPFTEKMRDALAFIKSRTS